MNDILHCKPSNLVLSSHTSIKHNVLVMSDLGPSDIDDLGPSTNFLVLGFITFLIHNSRTQGSKLEESFFFYILN